MPEGKQNVIFADPLEAQRRMMALAEELDVRERMLRSLCAQIQKEEGRGFLLYMLSKAGEETPGFNPNELVEWLISHEKADEDNP